MTQVILLRRYPLLFIIPLILSSCGGGGGDTPSESTGANTNNGDIVADSTYTIRTVAKFESGLVKLAQIGDTLAAAGLGDVSINYNGATVEGGSAKGLLANCEGLFNRKNCSVYGNVTYETPGTYSYIVSYTPSGLFAERVALRGTVIVSAPSDFVVVSIGDSVASGEGSPQYPWVNLHEGPYWNDATSNYDFGVDGCHRSAYAGPALAVNKLKQTNDITFIHIACSGASLNNDPMGKGAAWKHGKIERINEQLNWVRERVNRIDALVISGGANNVAGGFGQVVAKCVDPRGDGDVKSGLWCSEDAAFQAELKSSIAALPVAYADLQKRIDPRDNAGNPLIPEEQIPSVVAITEYFDPTRDANGGFPNVATSIACGLGTISPAEWEFLYNEMVVPLNNQVRAAADLHKWEYVEGIADAFRTHGYCASATPGDFSGKSWVVKFPESISNQKDQNGTGHPDILGQSVYRDRIYTTLVQANPPRTSASATTGGQPYTFGTWTSGYVDVTLHARNPIKESGVRETYYAIDEPQCNVGSVDVGACLPYYTPITITESGRHTVSFFSYNSFGAPETRAKPVEVLIDKEPPVMTCSAAPDELWPPNKRMISITASVTAIDEVSGPSDYILVAIQDSAGDANNAVQDFVIGTSDTQGMMLADRTGYGGNRYYTLTYQSEDAVGNVGTCDVIVQVPHDQSNN